MVSIAISMLSAATAVVALVVSLMKNRRDTELAVTKWKKEYFSDMVKWSDECIMLLSEALHLCDLDPKRCEAGGFYASRHLLLVKLSAQIDKGRWFFPNYVVDHHGQDNEEAFRGYRHEVLDGLVLAYWSLKDLDYQDKAKNTDPRKRILQAKRSFTSEIQKVLSPKSRDDEFKKITRT